MEKKKVYFSMYKEDHKRVMRLVEDGKYDSFSHFARQAILDKLEDEGGWTKIKRKTITPTPDLYSTDILEFLKKHGEATTPNIIEGIKWDTRRSPSGIESGVRRRLKKLEESGLVVKRWIPRTKSSDNQADKNTGCWMWMPIRKEKRMLTQKQTELIRLLQEIPTMTLDITNDSKFRWKYGNTIKSLIQRGIIERDLIVKRGPKPKRKRIYIKDVIALTTTDIPLYG